MGKFKEQGMKQNHRNPLLPHFLIAMPISQKVKRDRHKDKERAVPTIKSKFASYVTYRINGNPGMPRMT